MKYSIPLVLLASSLFSLSAHANQLEQEKLLQYLTQVTHQPVDAKENTTFYFAGSDGVIELERSGKRLELSLRSSVNSTRELNLGLENSRNVKLESFEVQNGEATFQLVNYSMLEGAREVYSVTKLKVKSGTGFSVSAEQKTFWAYEKSGNDLSNYHWVKLAQPKMEDVQVEAPFILSLNEENLEKMGQQASENIMETRAPQGGHCTMTTSSVLECNWSLETDYTPDTLKGQFSVKDGKVNDLIHASLEYGC
jgi:hypothetical protein